LAKLEGASPDAPRIFGSAGTLPSKTNCHPLLAIRYSPFAAVTFRVLLQTDAIPMFCFSGFADASVKPCPPEFVKGSQPHDKVGETEKQNYRHNGSDDTD